MFGSNEVTHRKVLSPGLLQGLKATVKDKGKTPLPHPSPVRLGGCTGDNRGGGDPSVLALKSHKSQQLTDLALPRRYVSTELSGPASVRVKAGSPYSFLSKHK